MAKKVKNILSTLVDSLMDCGRNAVDGIVKATTAAADYREALESGKSHSDIVTALETRKATDARTHAAEKLTKLRAALDNTDRDAIISKAISSNPDAEITAESLGLPPKRAKQVQSDAANIAHLCEMMMAYQCCLLARGEGQHEFDFIRIASDDDKNESGEETGFTVGNPVVLDGDDNEIELTYGRIFTDAINKRIDGNDSLQQQMNNPELKYTERQKLIANKLTRGVSDCISGSNGARCSLYKEVSKTIREEQSEMRRDAKESEKIAATKNSAIDTCNDRLQLNGPKLKQAFEQAEHILGVKLAMPNPLKARVTTLVENADVAADLAKGARSEIVKAIESVTK